MVGCVVEYQVVDGCVVEWVGIWLTGWSDGWMDGWMAGSVSGWLGGWLNVCMAGYVAGWIDVWLYSSTTISLPKAMMKRFVGEEVR